MRTCSMIRCGRRRSASARLSRARIPAAVKSCRFAAARNRGLPPMPPPRPPRLVGLNAMHSPRIVVGIPNNDEMQALLGKSAAGTLTKAEDARLTQLHQEARNHVMRSANAAQHRDFLATGDPMFAFVAYSTSRTCGEPPPEWVLKFLDEAVERWFEAYGSFSESSGKTRKRSNRPGDALVDAFIKRELGQRTIWTDAQLRRRRWEMGMAVCTAFQTVKAQGKPINYKAAITDAA